MSRWAPLTLAALGLAGLGVAIAGPAPRVVWNASASAPLGLYELTHGPIARGDFVFAEPPPSARRLAVRRGYLPATVRLVKRVTALDGDTVCASHLTVAINGRLAATRLAHDSHGRPLPAWTGCRTLAADEVFLLMEGVPDSFDGRYFGPVPRTAIVGKLLPLWTFWPGQEGGGRDSRINRVPSDSTGGLVCTSVSVTAPLEGCRHRSEKSLKSLLTKPVSGEEGADRMTQSVRPLSQRGGGP